MTSEPTIAIAKWLGHDMITIWDADLLQAKKATCTTPKSVSMFFEKIDGLGAASGKAQGLPHVLTTAQKMLTSDHRLYLYSYDGEPLGLIKVGKKKLFIRNDAGTYKEIEPLCVLDFYVSETLQRQGIGKRLYDRMVQNERVEPHRLGYDRPSPKFLAFLAKHFGLKQYTPQANNFVVFKKYFDTEPAKSGPLVEGGIASVSMRPLTQRTRTARSLSANPPTDCTPDAAPDSTVPPEGFKLPAPSEMLVGMGRRAGSMRRDSSLPPPTSEAMSAHAAPVSLPPTGRRRQQSADTPPLPLPPTATGSRRNSIVDSAVQQPPLTMRRADSDIFGAVLPPQPAAAAAAVGSGRRSTSSDPYKRSATQSSIFFGDEPSTKPATPSTARAGRRAV